MKVAITFSYLGDKYHGSQIQPSLKTVQGELEKACKRLKWSSKGIKISSRTDAGVNARMNFAVIEVPEGIKKDLPNGLLKGLNDILPSSICVYDAEEVSDDCNIRNATSRIYRYRMELLENWNKNIDLDYYNGVLNLFLGEHDFSNFYKKEDDRSTIRIIEEISPWVSKENRIIGFEIKSKGFLWNQVRRIASCINGILNGDFSKKDVIKSLKLGSVKFDFGLAPSRWLTLWHLEHEKLIPKIRTSFTEPPIVLDFEEDRRVNSIIIEAESKKHHAWLQFESSQMLKQKLEE
ncbi:MAG: tRNA pseudouridine(38-40) synthase TruA [Euryarchaeota archaeon]|nr:tRNA pseudouridine(38-40) synthase TruA [Euryarchaeota archaeon]